MIPKDMRRGISCDPQPVCGLCFYCVELDVPQPIGILRKCSKWNKRVYFNEKANHHCFITKERYEQEKKTKEERKKW